MAESLLEDGKQKLGQWMDPDDPSRTPEEIAALPHYAALMALYPAGYLGFTALRRRLGKELPEHISPYDFLILSGAAHRLSRILTRERVTEPLRAAVTEKDRPGGSVENEKPRGRGARRILGELLTCPFCTGSWTASLLAYSLVLAPKHTRFVAGIFAMDAFAGLLHCVVARLKK